MKSIVPISGIVLSVRERKAFTNKETGEVTPSFGQFQFAQYVDDDQQYQVIDVKCSLHALLKLIPLIPAPDSPLEHHTLNVEIFAWVMSAQPGSDAKSGISYRLVESTKS